MEPARIEVRVILDGREFGLKFFIRSDDNMQDIKDNMNTLQKGVVSIVSSNFPYRYSIPSEV